MILLIVAAGALVHLPKSGPLPDYDYWNMFGVFLTEHGLQLSFARFYNPSNEHIVAVANVFYLLNYHLFSGDNRGLVATTWLFSLVEAVVLLRLFFRSVQGVWPASVAALFVALCIFNPMAAHNFFQGMSGVAWIGANLFTVLALAANLRFQQGSGKRWLVGAVILAALAAQTYSTGVVAMLALAAQLLAFPRTRRLGVGVLLLGLGLLALVALTQSVPVNHPERTLNPLAIAMYALAFLGGAFVANVHLAIGIGLAGIVGFGAQAVRSVRSRAGDGLTALWIGLGVYALINAGLGGVARSGFGLASSLSERYVTVPSLFWISFVGIFVQSWARSRAGGGWTLRPALVLSAALVPLAPMLLHGAPRVRAQVQRAEQKALAALAVYLGVLDENLIESSVGPVAKTIWSSSAALAASGHVPFNGRFAACPLLGQKLEVMPSSGLRLVRGQLDGVGPLPGGAVSAFGWAAGADLRPYLGSDCVRSTDRCMALVNEDGIVRGLAIGGFSRPDVRQALLPNCDAGDRYGWQGFARPDAADERLFAVAPAGNVWTPLVPLAGISDEPVPATE